VSGLLQTSILRGIGMQTESVRYDISGASYSGALIYDRAAAGKAPLLLVAPNWLGVTPQAIERGKTLAERGFTVFVADMYGEGVRPQGAEQAAPLANALRADPDESRRRINGAMDRFVRDAADRAIGDTSRRAAIGFCFGGGNVLELARSGADLQAVVSVHGDLTSGKPASPGEIKSAVLALHGAADPVSPKSQRDAFEAEMDAAAVRWRLMCFGGIVHAYTDVDAAVPGIAEYDEPASRTSYLLAEAFISDSFAGRL
jgi:dienelactone hydrolase